MIFVDQFSIYIAALVYLALTALWYAPIFFGKLYLRYSGVDPITLPKKWMIFILSYAIGLLMSFFLAFLEGFIGVTSFWDGLFSGILIWIGFIVPTQFSLFLWRQKNIKMLFLDLSFWLLSFGLLGGIVAG